MRRGGRCHVKALTANTHHLPFPPVLAGFSPQLLDSFHPLTHTSAITESLNFLVSDHFYTQVKCVNAFIRSHSSQLVFHPQNQHLSSLVTRKRQEHSGLISRRRVHSSRHRDQTRQSNPWTCANSLPSMRSWLLLHHRAGSAVNNSSVSATPAQRHYDPLRWARRNRM